MMSLIYITLGVYALIIVVLTLWLLKLLLDKFVRAVTTYVINLWRH